MHGAIDLTIAPDLNPKTDTWFFWDTCRVECSKILNSHPKNNAKAVTNSFPCVWKHITKRPFKPCGGKDFHCVKRLGRKFGLERTFFGKHLDTRFENLVKWIFGLLNQPMCKKNRFIFEKLWDPYDWIEIPCNSKKLLL